MMRLVSEVKNVKQPVRYGFRIGDCVWVRRTLVTSRSLHFVDARIELEHIHVGESVSVYTQCRSQLATEFSSTDVALRYCKRIAIVQGAFKRCTISNWNQTQSNQLFTIYKFLFRWLDSLVFCIWNWSPAMSLPKCAEISFESRFIFKDSIFWHFAWTIANIQLLFSVRIHLLYPNMFAHFPQALKTTTLYVWTVTRDTC